MWIRLVLAGLLLIAAPGCVRRQLTIHTDPPGAQIYVNDAFKGESPVVFDPVWYGSYRVTARKEGYELLSERRKLRAPWYLWIPLDLVMELLPFRVRDERVWSFQMQPLEELPAPMPEKVVTP